MVAGPSTGTAATLLPTATDSSLYTCQFTSDDQPTKRLLVMQFKHAAGSHGLTTDVTTLSLFNLPFVVEGYKD